jgi:hypothetical protein
VLRVRRCSRCATVLSKLPETCVDVGSSCLPNTSREGASLSMRKEHQNMRNNTNKERELVKTNIILQLRRTRQVFKGINVVLIVLTKTILIHRLPNFLYHSLMQPRCS